ncbi:unnamed protein product [Cuscuta campestris]|uniref:Retroviral polymerase SH3-like domain-containing protein n=1 Tax=Cuscuta campestris TaxID=132261 RepID=A0A484M2R5_9ASTE|nr:unnamed protein product [Cuscuta campestris]
MDSTTESFSRPSVARFYVEMDLSKPPQNSFYVKNGDTPLLLQAEFENLPEFCKVCRGINRHSPACKLSPSPMAKIPSPNSYQITNPSQTDLGRDENIEGKLLEAEQTNPQPEDRGYHSDGGTISKNGFKPANRKSLKSTNKPMDSEIKRRSARLQEKMTSNHLRTKVARKFLKKEKLHGKNFLVWRADLIEALRAIGIEYVLYRPIPERPKTPVTIMRDIKIYHEHVRDDGIAFEIMLASMSKKLSQQLDGVNSYDMIVRLGDVFINDDEHERYLAAKNHCDNLKRKRDDSSASGKLDAKSDKCVFVGYPKETRGYYFYHPTDNKVFVARTGPFLEKEFLSKAGDGRKIDLEEIQDNEADNQLDEERQQEEQIVVPQPTQETQALQRSMRTRNPPEREEDDFLKTREHNKGKKTTSDLEFETLAPVHGSPSALEKGDILEKLPPSKSYSNKAE